MGCSAHEVSEHCRDDGDRQTAALMRGAGAWADVYVSTV